jgi:DNA-binding NarL/FixJ family response regulator
MSALRIAIADDHPLMRAALGHALRELLTDGTATEAASFEQLRLAIEQHPQLDLVLLDLNMPGARGFSSLVWLRGERPALPVIVISSSDHPRTVRRAQQFGAAGFVSKSAPAEVLREAIAAVMDGGSWFPAEKAERSEEDAQLAARLAQLTPQQLRVLMAMAEGLLNKQIAHELGLAENTVKVHVTAILRKLGCYSRTQAAVMLKALEAEGAAPEGALDARRLLL